jgi:hypothetical protein
MAVFTIGLRGVIMTGTGTARVSIRVSVWISVRVGVRISIRVGARVRVDNGLRRGD